MSGIRSKDTVPELTIRKELHRLGYRYRLHVKRLPGKPDIVLPKYNAVILIHGCFWHSHDCHLFKMPSSRIDFWRRKLRRNAELDSRSLTKLTELGWKILIIWECAIKGKKRMPLQEVINSTIAWLDAGQQYSYSEIKG